ncbi:hypothetical protein wVul_1524 [Wolbachia endosymbiont of Armadillidium vulgare str. wVulC]|uniref:hypothetical protein n=1 Tax=Wolbachia endosymbiont of Armadillidium vulgare TaxID=77039 RepID=UPI0006D4C630|nr:hypothetical protein [Wolbachia endosymbiont of Armadillidium vulgare]KLT21779.1 hypothetical protein wVul_1524 [Wolbachia endosymbiont of Armadillidium vulgare str. wVulC]
MNKDNNSWPYQKFHDANKSSSKSSVIWESRFYEYNNSGEIEKIRYQWEKKKNPASLLYQISYDCATQSYSPLSIKSR